MREARFPPSFAPPASSLRPSGQGRGVARIMTPHQRKALYFIRAYCGRRGQSPSYEEIRRALGLSHRSRVHGLVVSLEARGELTRVPGHSRSLRPVEPLDRLAERLLDNIMEEHPEAGWVKVRAGDIAALDLALAKRPGGRR